MIFFNESNSINLIENINHMFITSIDFTQRTVHNFNLLLKSRMRNISHPGFEEQIEVVNRTLSEINAGDKPMIYVFNKIDAFTFVEKDQDDLSPRTKRNIPLEEWERSWMAKNNTPSLFVSARTKDNIEALKKTLYNEVKKIHITRFPFNDFLYDSNWTISPEKE